MPCHSPLCCETGPGTRINGGLLCVSSMATRRSTNLSSFPIELPSEIGEVRYVVRGRGLHGGCRAVLYLCVGGMGVGI